MKRITRAVALMATAFAALTLANGANAQEYPTGPVTIVAPFPPGASTDTSLRILVPKMSEFLGQPVVVDNRPGSSGNVGTAHVARAEPDGYTLLWTVNAPVSMSKFTFSELPYDAQEDLQPIIWAGSAQLALAVHPSLPVDSVEELVEYAKANPGQIQYGSAGIGSAHHINGELINREAGIDMVHVPYPGGGPAIADLVGGHIMVSFGTLPAVLPHHQEGSIKIIALAEAERYEGLPDIPTISETLSGVGIDTWVGLLAPAGTPDEIVNKLNDAVRHALEDSEVQEFYKNAGLQVVASTPQELEEMIASEMERFAVLFPEIGVVPQ